MIISSIQERALVEFCRDAVASVFQARKPQILNLTLLDLVLPAEPVALYVNVLIDGQLRGCLGGLFASQPLLPLLAALARKAALYDDRFAPIEEGELASLECGFWWGSKSGTKDAYLYDAVAVRQNDKFGFMLPYVGQENDWSSEALLKAVLAKAGISEGAFEKEYYRVRYCGDGDRWSNWRAGV